MASELPAVRIEVGENPILTRVYINGEEFKGVTRVWFDSGDVSGNDGPRRAFAQHTRIHLDFYAQSLLVTGNADVDAIEQRPARIGS